MKTSLKSTLEETIQQWAEESAQRKDWPNNGDWNDRVAGQMATAAMAVFEANFTGQQAQREHAS